MTTLGNLAGLLVAPALELLGKLPCLLVGGVDRALAFSNFSGHADPNPGTDPLNDDVLSLFGCQAAPDHDQVF